MEDYELYDSKLLEAILYDNNQSSTTYELFIPSPCKIKFTPDPLNLQSEDSEKLEKLLQGQHLSSKKTEQSFDPLDLIQSKELFDMSFTTKALKAYLNDKRQYQASKLPTVHSQILKDLSSQLSSPTTIKTTRFLIIIGNAYGLLSIYTNHCQEIKTIQSPKSFGAVTTIDVSSDEQFIIAGYAGGQLCLWDFKSGSSIRANNSYHNASISAFKFWKDNNLAISADVNGKVMLVEYSKSFLSTSITGVDLLKGEIGGVFDVSILSSETDHHALDNNIVIAIGGFKAVLIYLLYPEITCIYTIPRPESLNSYLFPSVVWKYCKIGSNQDYSLSIAWGNAIVIYKVKFPIPEGVELWTVFEVPLICSFLIWMSPEILMAVTDKNQILVKPGDHKIICELNRDFLIVGKNTNKENCFFKCVDGYDRMVFILGFKEIIQINLLTWNECIDELSNKGEWLEVLSFGLDLYTNNYESQYGFPETREELRNILEQLITIYVKVGTIDWIHKISNTIEFCAGIDALDILFNMLFDFFIDNGAKENMEYFVNTLEPYILSGKISKIPSFVIGKLMAFYLRKETPEIIEKVLLNLDKDSIDPEQVLPIIKEYKLLTAGIVVYTNIDNFVEPLVLIYNSFAGEKEIVKKKAYFYKLLWYVRMCFNGELFLNKQLSTVQHFSAIKDITRWLLEDNVLESLIKQDIVCLLHVFWLIFNAEHKEICVKTILSIEKFAKDTYFFFQFCCFIAKVTETGEILVPDEVSIKVAMFLLKIKENIENIPIGGNDILSYIQNITYGEQERLSFADFTVSELGKITLKLLKSCKTISEQDITSLLSAAESSSHTLIQVFLLDYQKNYIKSLYTHLKTTNPEEKVLIFDWLDQKFRSNGQTELKNEVIEVLSILVEIDSDKTAHLVRDWYQNSHGFIIKKLDNAPNLQLKYLGELLKDQFDKDLVLKYVKLLCQHSPSKVLKFLKSGDVEYFEECLKICADYKVVQAEAYLHEKLGAIKEALELWISTIQKTRFELFGKMRKKEVILPSIISDLGKKINKYCKVCIRNSEALDLTEIEEFWFSIFRNTLDCYMEFKEFFYLYPQLEPIIHSSINNILTHMLQHVDLSSIITCISSEYEDFPFKHIRDNIIEVLIRFSHQQSIINQALKLLQVDRTEQISLLYSLRLQGHASDFVLCRSCGKKINDSTTGIYIFACGHVYHKRCQEIPACLICNDTGFY